MIRVRLVDNYYRRWYYVIPNGGRVMEKDNIDPMTGSTEETPTGEEGAGSNRERAIESSEPELTSLKASKGPTSVWSPQPTVLTLQDLLDIPRQIIPEQTYVHLRNAGREALLAIVSLVSGLNNTRRDPEDAKIRKRIDVE
jgi:hypothetical protein